MVGGRIVHMREETDRICVTVADAPYGRHEFCGVDVEKTTHPLALGDSLWWQGGMCYWTPETGSHREDTPIRKIGGSYGVGRERAMASVVVAVPAMFAALSEAAR